MRFAPVVVRRVDRVRDPPKLAAAIDLQCNNLLGEWRSNDTTPPIGDLHPPTTGRLYGWIGVIGFLLQQ